MLNSAELGPAYKSQITNNCIYFFIIFFFFFCLLKIAEIFSANKCENASNEHEIFSANMYENANNS